MKLYKEIRNHPEDFIVRYTLYTKEEGGRKITYQHLRCDFMYEGDDPETDGIYMIHPEFIDENGVPIKEKTSVPLSGRASMWVLIPEMRDKIHKFKIEVGVRGYFMEGARKVGEIIVEKIVGLHENHT